MALICPVCSAENREGANFCKSCGGRLASLATAPRMPAPPAPPVPRPGSTRFEREWASTAPAQLRAPAIPGELFDPGAPLSRHEPVESDDDFEAADEKTVIVPASKPPEPSPGAVKKEKPLKVKPQRPAPVPRPAGKNGTMLWAGLLVVAAVILGVGWYGLGGRKTVVAEVMVPPPLPAPRGMPAPSASPPVVVARTPAVGPAASAAAFPASEPQTSLVTPSSEPEVETEAPLVAVAPKPVAPKPPVRKPPSVASPSATSAAAAAAAAAAAMATPVVSAEPMSQCGDRNFIARAQCMAAQCLKPEYQSHGQCEAVRRQQKLEEEKRNPSLIN